MRTIIQLSDLTSIEFQCKDCGATTLWADGGSHESDDYLACKDEQWMTHGGQFYGDLWQLIELVQRPGKADGGEIRYAVWSQRGVIYWGRDQDFMGRQVLFGQSLALKAKLFEMNISPLSPSGSRFCEGQAVSNKFKSLGMKILRNVI